MVRREIGSRGPPRRLGRANAAPLSSFTLGLDEPDASNLTSRVVVYCRSPEANPIVGPLFATVTVAVLVVLPAALLTITR